MLTLLLVASLLNPVEGVVVRGFAGGPDPFAAGLRRGVVLRAAPGTAVRSPCGGRVTFAGRTPRGPAVTVRCGGRRVTVMPVAAAVRRGLRVRRGAVIGRARGNVRLSLRERGAYLDPEPLLEADAPPVGLAPPPGARRPVTPRLAPPPGARRPLTPRPTPPAAPRLAAPEPTATPPMPWTAWAGVALLLVLGASGLRLRVRSRRPLPSIAAAARSASDGG